MIVRFWEARVVPGRLDDAVAWVNEQPAAQAVAAGAESVEVLVAVEDPDTDNPPRVVLITRWSASPTFVEPAADPAIIARSHAWDFFPA